MGVFEWILELYRAFGEPVLMVAAVVFTFIGIALTLLGQFIYRKIDDALFWWKFRDRR